MFKWIALHRLAPSFRVATRKRLTDYYTPSGPNVYTRRFVWSISLDTRLNRLPNANPTTCIRHTRDCTYETALQCIIMRNAQSRIHKKYTNISICMQFTRWLDTRKATIHLLSLGAFQYACVECNIYVSICAWKEYWIFSYSLRALRGSPSSKIPLKIRIT